MNLRHPCRLRPLAAAVAALFSAPLLAAPAPDALPTGGQVVAGQASIAQTGAAMTVTQGSDRAILHWQGFDIGAQASVQFVQPSSSAVALNRVLAGEASQIYGTLSANGIVYLVNPNGVIFGAGSRVDVGGLVASSMNIADDDFLAGRDVFQRNGALGKIVNRGEITAKDGGLVALLAPEVLNEGVISARLGNVVLAAGERITLEAGAGGHLHVAVDPATVSALVENRHLVQADGGQVVMSAQAADTLLSAVVANGGTVQARTLENRAGRIYLLADMAQGEVRHDGLLDASAPDSGDGGFVETSAAKVGRGQYNDGARVTTLAANGQTGLWLIDPNDYTIAASGGNITGAQLSTDLGSSNVQISTATQGTAGGNGDIFVNDAVAWSANKLTLTAERNIQINANLNGSGTAQLALEVGQGAVAAGNTADYYVNGAKVTLPAGANFSTKLGSDGATDTYTVITSLGVAGDATTTTLQGMKNNLTGKYALGADIDASATSGWNAGAGWEPVGGGTEEFEGNFAGLGHTISGLTINRAATDRVGLIGYLSGNGYNRVRNVGLVGGTVIGRDYVGGLAGYFAFGSIVGSYATASVSGDRFVGGLVGYFDFGGIVGSYATASVSGDQSVGGLVGEFPGAGAIINSYATGAVSGTYDVGGLVRSSATITNSYWDTQTSGIGTSGGGTGKTTAQMQQQATFAGWDFDNVWRIYEGASYPVLRAFQQDLTVTASNASKTYDGAAYSGGNGVSYSVPGATHAGALSYGGSSQGATNAGSYAIAPSIALTQQDYQNWHVSYANGTLTVDPATLTLGGATAAADKTYDGTTAATVSGGTLVGVIGADAVSLVQSGTFDTKDVGPGKTVTYTNSLTGAAAGNYTTPAGGTTLAEIIAKALTVTANNASKTHDGNAWSGGNGVAYSGFVNSETAAVLGGALGWGGNSQGAIALGSYVLTPSGLTSGNYAITFVDGVLTIAERPAATTSDTQPNGGQLQRQQATEIAAAPPAPPVRVDVPPPPTVGGGVGLNGLLVFAPGFIRGGEE